jgi:hypothetical protein
MSPSGHPTLAQLERFLAGGLATAEVKAVVRHLLAGCAACCGHVERRLDRGPEPGAAGEGDPAAGRVWVGRTWAGGRRMGGPGVGGPGRRSGGEEPIERLLAASLWAALGGRPQDQRLRWVADDPRFHEPALVEHLIELGRPGWGDDPHEARERAEVARAVAERLDPRAHLPGLAGDCRTAALAHLGDVQRRCEDLAGAERSFAQAWESLDEGSGDPLERANLMALEAVLRLAQGETERGMRRLRSAASIYRRCGDRVEEGRAVLQLARACGHRDPARGAALARRALGLVDGRREPELELAARHALAWFVNDGGDGGQALALLEGSRALYREGGGAKARLYERWLEGRICRTLGELGAAEETLKSVWRDVRAAGFNLDLTLVSLDLAEVLLAAGKRRQAALLARWFEPRLRLFKMHGHGMAAWLVVREALGVEAGRVGEALASEVARERVGVMLREAALYYRRAWRRAVPFRRRRG